MADFEALVAMRDDNEHEQLKILTETIAGYERNYEKYKHGPVMNFLDRSFNQGLRRSTEKHISESTELTLTALRMSSRLLANWGDLTEAQRVELGRYCVGRASEGNVYLEEKN